MKTLNKFIVDKYVENYLFEKLCTHISLELKWEYGKGLNPHFKFYESIYESLGKFNNAGNVVEHICNELKNNFKSQVIDCRDDKVYFDFIDITIERGADLAEYIEYKNNTIYIILYSTPILFNDDIDQYAKLILHELLHGYEDYNRIKTGKQSQINTADEKYIRSTYALNSLYDIRRYLAQCRYFLDSAERNAYFSGLEADIIKLLKSGDYSLDTFNYEKFKKDLSMTDLWETFYELSIFVDGLSKLNDDKKKKVEEEYSKLFKEDKTFNSIYKEITRRWRKFDSKFNQLIPKIICNNLSIKESREFTFTINKLNEKFEL